MKTYEEELNDLGEWVMGEISRIESQYISDSLSGRDGLEMAEQREKTIEYNNRLAEIKRKHGVV